MIVIIHTDYCEELMSMSLKRLDQSLRALKSPGRNNNDIQTWLSASLTFQQSCKDYAHAHATILSADGLMQRMCNKMEFLSQLGSNSLALVNHMSTKASHKVGTNEEEDEFPKWVSAKGRKLLQGGTIKANAIVAQDGSGNYKTVSDAIKAASGKRFVIYVKEGIYKEKIRTSKDGITLVGDGKYSTLIVGDDSVAKGSILPDSATFSEFSYPFPLSNSHFSHIIIKTPKKHTNFMTECPILSYKTTLASISY